MTEFMLMLVGGRASFGDYEKADVRIRSEPAVPCVLVRPEALKNKPGTGKYNLTTRLMKILAYLQS